MKGKFLPSLNKGICRTNATSVFNKKTGKRSTLGILSAALLVLPMIGCSASNTEGAASKEGSTSTLLVTANGEDFVRQGFVDKDGWQISFDNVYVTLSDIVVAQKEPTINAVETDTSKAAKAEVVAADSAITVDLAAGDENAEPVLVTAVEDAPVGRYNALSWQMAAPTSGDSAGYPLTMVGTATKADESIDFEIKLTEELSFVCGDFIGDERKGVLTAEEPAEVEATFHFDHIFGDAEAADDDEINTGALGFDALAALAEDGDLSVTSEDLAARLSPEDYNTLKTVLTSLGHVGEGHCESTLIDG